MDRTNAPLGDSLKYTPRAKRALRRKRKAGEDKRMASIKDERRARQNYNNALQARGIAPRGTLKRNPKGRNVRASLRKGASL